MNGFFEASQAAFGKRPAELTQQQFFTMLAVPIAPRTMKLTAPTADLVERTARIERLLHGRCKPIGLRDVWLNACASPRET
jgi:membrane peptidoglycan carboxypeptidase